MTQEELLATIEEATRTGATTLDLVNNQLTALPPELFQLTALTELHLSFNQLTALPPEIAQLTALTELHLANNQLTALPPEIGKLKELRELYLYQNQLIALPPEIGQLTGATTLDLVNNQLTALPPEIGQLTALTRLDLDGNPLKKEFATAYKQGVPVLLNYLRRILEEGQTLYEVKLVLVGEGDVGKTTLLDALLGKPPIKNRSSTEGLEIAHEQIELPHPDTKHILQCNAWDFGGQKTYRVQHQFFFSENAVYLLVWDPRSGTQKCDVDGWLERIQLRVGDKARVLIVSSYAADKAHPPHISTTELRDKYGKLIHGFYAVDGMEYKTNDGMRRLLDELKEAIANAAASLTGREFPRSWQKVREEVKALKAKEPCLTFTHFVEICKQQDLTELDTTTLAAIMNEIGDFVYFANAKLDAASFDKDDCPETSDNIIVLQPEWLAKAIGFLVEDERTIKLTDGVLNHSELKRIWHDARTKPYRYPTELHPYFLWLMEEFFISYRLNPDKKSLVPQLITETRPDKLRYEAGDGSAPHGELELNLICEMKQNPPPGIVPQMIVACHQYRYKVPDYWDKNWQRGAFFDRGRLGTALMELKDRELWFTVRDGHPDYFLYDLRQTLEKRIADVWPGLDYRLVVPCPTRKEGSFCKGRFQLQALQNAHDKGNKTYPCQECYVDQPIEPLLKGIDYSSVSEIARLMAESLLHQKDAHSLSLDLYRRLLIAIGSETKEAPCMFTLFPFDTTGAMQNHQLTLWCELPDAPHSCCPVGSGGEGEYIFTRPKEWYARVLPYLVTISKILKATVPVVGGAAGAFWGHKDLKEIKPEMDTAEKTGGLLPSADSRNPHSYRATMDGFRAEADALRAIHDVLRELQPKKGRKWGGLERIATRSGEYIWLCEKHAREYDPGLPILD